MGNRKKRPRGNSDGNGDAMTRNDILSIAAVQATLPQSFGSPGQPSIGNEAPRPKRQDIGHKDRLNRAADVEKIKDEDLFKVSIHKLPAQAPQVQMSEEKSFAEAAMRLKSEFPFQGSTDPCLDVLFEKLLDVGGRLDDEHGKRKGYEALYHDETRARIAAEEKASGMEEEILDLKLANYKLRQKLEVKGMEANLGGLGIR